MTVVLLIFVYLGTHLAMPGASAAKSGPATRERPPHGHEDHDYPTDKTLVRRSAEPFWWKGRVNPPRPNPPRPNPPPSSPPLPPRSPNSHRMTPPPTRPRAPAQRPTTPDPRLPSPSTRQELAAQGASTLLNLRRYGQTDIHRVSSAANLHYSQVTTQPGLLSRMGSGGKRLFQRYAVFHITHI